MGKKDLLASILIKTGAIHILHKLRQSIKKELPVLAYHRILDISDINDYHYDSEVIDATIDGFEKQMKFISKHYNPISIQDLYNYTNTNNPLPKNPILITFDDGFNDNYYNAFPILKKYNIPATLFIATNHIGTDQPFWFERLSHLILTTPKTELSIDELNFHKNITNNINERRQIYNDCVELLKYKNKTTCIRIIDKLEQEHSITISNDDKKMSCPLTWKQCQEMAESVITFGSHGASHTIFTQLEDNELHTELAKSKKIIEDKIKCPVIALSFPNGQTNDFNTSIVNTIYQHGYKLIFSYLHGINTYQDIGKKTLNRIHPPQTDNLRKFQLYLTLPEIF